MYPSKTTDGIVGTSEINNSVISKYDILRNPLMRCKSHTKVFFSSIRIRAILWYLAISIAPF